MDLMPKANLWILQPSEARLGGCLLSKGEQPSGTVLRLCQRLRITGLALTVGWGPGIKPHLSCLCDLELVISLHSEKTEIKHLPQPLTGTSQSDEYSEDECVGGVEGY